jgi:N6-L-threonylcarbamoyladenine synthase
MHLVLGIESSCDETAAAVVAGGREIRSSVVASQVETHCPYGGVVPELASREHLAKIAPVVDAALAEAGIRIEDVDGIAVTCGPGLVGSLLVGVSYAKSLAYVHGKPLVGVNHIEGHIYSVVFENGDLELPAVALVVSGGHTSLYLIREPERYELLGRTRDDAAGEAYDKTAKLLGLGYPGGPILDRLARLGDPERAPLVFHVPQMREGALDFSFSGLKTAVLRYVREHGIRALEPGEEPSQEVCDLAASFQRAVVWSLRARVRKAVERYAPRSIVLAGGVACNSSLREAIDALGRKAGVRVLKPSPALTTDNAAMIAAAGFPKLARGERAMLTLTADPSLRLQGSLESQESR